MDNLNREKDKFIYIPTENILSKYNRSIKAYSDYYSYTYEEGKEFCYECLALFSKEEVKIIKDENDAVYCEDCYNKRYTECIECGKPFVDPAKTHLKCEHCRNSNK